MRRLCLTGQFFTVAGTTLLYTTPLAVRSAPFGYIAVAFPPDEHEVEQHDSDAVAHVTLFDYFRGGTDLRIAAEWPLLSPSAASEDALDATGADLSSRTVLSATLDLARSRWITQECFVYFPHRVMCCLGTASSGSAVPVAAQPAISLSWMCMADGSLGLAVATGRCIDVYGRLRASRYGHRPTASRKTGPHVIVGSCGQQHWQEGLPRNGQPGAVVDTAGDGTAARADPRHARRVHRARGPPALCRGNVDHQPRVAVGLDMGRKGRCIAGRLRYGGPRSFCFVCRSTRGVR